MPEQLDLPARPEYLPVAAACVTQIIALAHHMPRLETLAYDIQLAVQEACANIVDNNIPVPSNKRRGRGLGLIRRTMDEVEYERQVGENKWRLVKNLERPPAHRWAALG